MASSKQAPIYNSLVLREALFRQGLSVTALARRVKHPRPTVSAAIHHGRFPRVLSKIRKELGHG